MKKLLRTVTVPAVPPLTMDETYDICKVKGGVSIYGGNRVLKRKDGKPALFPNYTNALLWVSGGCPDESELFN